MGASLLSVESVEQRRSATQSSSRVAFRVKGLFGLSFKGMSMPLNKDEQIHSGQVSVTIDPDADESCNVGIVDFDQRKLKVKYGAQMVFPGLYKLVTEGRFDPGLLHPVRATATDECSVTEDYSGWHALGCLDFLPGSIWAGAAGG